MYSCCSPVYGIDYHHGTVMGSEIFDKFKGFGTKDLRLEKQKRKKKNFIGLGIVDSMD